MQERGSTFWEATLKSIQFSHETKIHVGNNVGKFGMKATGSIGSQGLTHESILHPL